MLPNNLSNSRRISQMETMSVKFSADATLDSVSKILIVDDERFNCDIIENFLMVLGLPNYKERSEQCYNGNQAVAKVKQAI